MSTIPQERMTPEEYLEFERAAVDCKHEFYKGEIFAMSGGTWQHSLLIAAVIRELGNALEGKPCQVFNGDLRIKVNESGLYTYPDASVICEEAQLEDSHKDTLLNPLVVVEVLSDSTEKYDRGQKFDFYRTIPSLKQYVLVSQNKPQVEVFTRSEDTGWLLTVATGKNTSIELTALECELSLGELYRQIDFSEPESLHPGD